VAGTRLSVCQADGLVSVSSLRTPLSST